MSIMVRSGPMPAIASAATTFTLAGKPAAASRAVPEKTSFGSFRPSTEIAFFTRCGAPASPFGGLRVVIVTEWIVPSAAAATASSPSSPPVGTMMRPPCCLGELEQFRARQQRAAGEHHHLLAGGEHRPADLLEDRGRRALDREVGMRGKFVERDDRHLDPLLVEPAARLLLVARRHAGERQPGHAVGELARERRPDRAEPRDGDAHVGQSAPAYCMAVIRCDNSSGNARLTRLRHGR